MVHDPISLLLGKTYQDSLLLQLPVSATGLVPGNMIPVARGYYAYSGTVLLQPERRKVVVHLFYNNYDDHLKDPLSWNGEYDLVIH